MSHNEKRVARMKLLSEQELKKRADAGTLASASAVYELRRRGVVYVPSAWWLGPNRH